MNCVAAACPSGTSRQHLILLHLSMLCGAAASAAIAPALVLARARDLGAGTTLLVAAGALPGLAGLATAWWTPVWGDPRRTTLIGIVVCRLLMVFALVAAPCLPGGYGLGGLFGALLAAQVAGIAIGGAALAWFARILGPDERSAVTSRRNAMGGVVGFAAALAAAAVIDVSGEQGWWTLAGLALAATALDVALLSGLPAGTAEEPQAGVTTGIASQEAPAKGYNRLWWRLHAGGALAAAAVLPALAAAGASASALVAIGGAGAAGAAVGMWRYHRIPADAPAAASSGRIRAGSLLLLAASVLAPSAGLPLPIALYAVAVATVLDGIAAGRCAAFDTATLYRLGGSDPAALVRLSAIARANAGLVALAAVLTAAVCTLHAALAPPLLLAIAVAIALYGWRSLAGAVPIPTVAR